MDPIWLGMFLLLRLQRARVWVSLNVPPLQMVNKVNSLLSEISFINLKTTQPAGVQVQDKTNPLASLLFCWVVISFGCIKYVNRRRSIEGCAYQLQLCVFIQTDWDTLKLNDYPVRLCVTPVAFPRSSYSTLCMSSALRLFYLLILPFEWLPLHCQQDLYLNRRAIWGNHKFKLKPTSDPTW